MLRKLGPARGLDPCHRPKDNGLQGRESVLLDLATEWATLGKYM